jgi:hypothetical protein
MTQPTSDKDRNADTKADKRTDAVSADRELSSAELSSVAGGKAETPPPDSKRV